MLTYLKGINHKSQEAFPPCHLDLQQKGRCLILGKSKHSQVLCRFLIITLFLLKFHSASLHSTHHVTWRLLTLLCWVDEWKPSLRHQCKWVSDVLYVHSCVLGPMSRSPCELLPVGEGHPVQAMLKSYTALSGCASRGTANLPQEVHIINLRSSTEEMKETPEVRFCMGQHSRWRHSVGVLCGSFTDKH